MGAMSATRGIVMGAADDAFPLGAAAGLICTRFRRTSPDGVETVYERGRDDSTI